MQEYKSQLLSERSIARFNKLTGEQQIELVSGVSQRICEEWEHEVNIDASNKEGLTSGECLDLTLARFKRGDILAHKIETELLRAR